MKLVRPLRRFHREDGRDPSQLRRTGPYPLRYEGGKQRPSMTDDIREIPPGDVKIPDRAIRRARESYRFVLRTVAHPSDGYRIY